MNLKEIVKRYDSFAWLPTIRGALSLDLIENSIIESTLPYARHTIGYSHRGQTRATIESTITNARHTMSDALMLHRLRDNNLPRILATTLRSNS